MDWTIVENDFRPAREPPELPQRRKQSLLRQIGCDTEPNDEGPLGPVQAGGLKRAGHAAAFEIVGDISDMRGFGDVRLGEAASLFGLGRRMIELEHSEVVGRLESIGERVETGAEHQNLSRAVVDRTGARNPPQTGCASR